MAQGDAVIRGHVVAEQGVHEQQAGLVARGEIVHQAGVGGIEHPHGIRAHGPLQAIQKLRFPPPNQFGESLAGQHVAAVRAVIDALDAPLRVADLDAHAGGNVLAQR